jgi:hypothetical protein
MSQELRSTQRTLLVQNSTALHALIARCFELNLSRDSKDPN